MISDLWKINGQSFASYGIAAATLTYVNQRADSLTFSREGGRFDGTLVFAKDAEITLTRDGVVWFTGRVRETPRRGSPQGESLGYTILGAWNKLERKNYLQNWAAPSDPDDPASSIVTVKRGRVVLGQNDAGARVKAGTFIASVITYAGFIADVDIGEIIMPLQEVSNLKCADVVIKYLGLTPDAVVWFDYTTTPLTCRIRRRAALTAVDIPINTGLIGAGGVSLDPVYKMQAERVAFFFIYTNRANSAAWETTESQVYPPGTTGEEDDAFVRTLKLAGSVEDSSYLTQKVKTVEIPEILQTSFLLTPDGPYGLTAFNDMANWWKRNVPWLNRPQVTVLGFRLGKVVRLPEADDENASDIPDLSLRQLGAGALTDWMIEDEEGLRTEQQNASVEVAYSITDSGDPSKIQIHRQKIEATIVATNAQTGTYSVLESASSTPPESIPPDLAQEVWKGLHVLHYAGTIMVQEEEATFRASIGNVLNIPDSAVDEWKTMNALVQQRAIALDSGQTTFTVGPPAQLGVEDLISVWQNQHTAENVTSSFSRATGKSAAQKKQALPTWQPIRPAQSGVPSAPRVYTADLSVAGVVPIASEFVTAIKTVYTTKDQPMSGDYIGFKVGGEVKFSGRVSMTTNGGGGIFTVAFDFGDSPLTTFYAFIKGIGIFKK